MTLKKRLGGHAILVYVRLSMVLIKKGNYVATGLVNPQDGGKLPIYAGIHVGLHERLN